MNYKIIGAVILGGVIGAGLMNIPHDLKLGADKPVLDWKKPVTDAEWAEDVKKEGFDYRSNEVLDEMIVSHTVKLDKLMADDKVVICPECVRYEIRESLSQTVPANELDAEVEAQYQTKLKTYLWEVEKLKQSVERMNKEKELRTQNKVQRVIYE
jgi:SAM-dependent MidA family methyltransferase